MTLVYTGIGSREAPDTALQVAYKLAFYLAHHGLTLRSGGAVGMDTAFATGATNRMGLTQGHYPRRDGLLEVFRPEDAQPWCYEEVSKHLDPGSTLDRMRPFVAGLLARNMQQVLGRDGAAKSAFVLYWTPVADGTARNAGGTRYAVRCAKAHGVPSLNLLNTSFQAALEWASEHTD